MPQLSIKAFFMDSQDWSPVGQQVPALHDLTVKTGLDLAVAQGIVIEVETGLDLAVAQGIVIEVKDATLDVKLDSGGDVEVT